MRFRQNPRWDDILPAKLAGMQHAWDRRHYFRRAVRVGISQARLARENAVSATIVHSNLIRAEQEWLMQRLSPAERWMGRSSLEIDALRGGIIHQMGKWRRQAAERERRRALYEELKVEFARDAPGA